MSKRIDVKIDADTWMFVRHIFAGEHSRAIKDALRARHTRYSRSR